METIKNKYFLKIKTTKSKGSGGYLAKIVNQDTPFLWKIVDSNSPKFGWR